MDDADDNLNEIYKNIFPIQLKAKHPEGIKTELLEIIKSPKSTRADLLKAMELLLEYYFPYKSSTYWAFTFSLYPRWS
jgi:hypothetical protein